MPRSKTQQVPRVGSNTGPLGSESDALPPCHHALLCCFWFKGGGGVNISETDNDGI